MSGRRRRAIEPAHDPELVVEMRPVLPVPPRARLRFIAGRLLVLEDERAALVTERDGIVRDLVDCGSSLRSVASDAGVSHVQLFRRARAGSRALR